MANSGYPIPPTHVPIIPYPKPRNYPQTQENFNSLFTNIYSAFFNESKARIAYNKYKELYLTNWKNNEYITPYNSISTLYGHKVYIEKLLKKCEEKENSLRKQLFTSLLNMLNERIEELIPKPPTKLPTRGGKTRKFHQANRKSRRRRRC